MISPSEFFYRGPGNRVRFGRPAADAISEAITLEYKAPLKIFVIASERNQKLVDSVKANSAAEVVCHLSEVIQHVPEELVKKAGDLVLDTQPDIILSIGGGSAVGLAKALVLEKKIPIWAVTTTYSGSEMTNIYGISTSGKKKVGRNENVLPELVIFDPELTQDMPYRIALTSATNALAHLVEAGYAVNNNPVTYAQALSGIRLIIDGYEDVISRGFPGGIANKNFLTAAYLGGKSLFEVAMSLHHKSAHVVGGNFGMDHASGHTVLLPFVLDYQWKHMPADVKSDFKSAFGDENPAQKLLGLLKKLEIPHSLEEIGFREEDLADAAFQIAAIDMESPAPVEQVAVESMLRKAWKGAL
ncbi:MAG: iron-containing alcohol dehydrogenase [Balneolia bacterium]|nr:iron-containing alcohol dehydrogenase [Balneolia bacterium]